MHPQSKQYSEADLMRLICAEKVLTVAQELVMEKQANIKKDPIVVGNLSDLCLCIDCDQEFIAAKLNNQKNWKVQ